MLLASLLEMSSGLLPGDSTLTPRRHGAVKGQGDALPGFSCTGESARMLGAGRQPVGEMAPGDGEVGLM